ncbi:YegS/Rv2252/BmrU family lipid kinase [uncultured Tyzzerella sp.]|uniref:diacylglycerol/lipid kinase family protein n=1 Tax=uncultured Tyzzerella sp. TaxID=2321398 RepID=UPI002943C6AE|nr:YegS/Rv2252/BmrU family lipid kinase [uncultured Tyzzerella sp.]
MKKIKLIYNPYSGDKTFKFDLDIYVTNLQEAGYEVHMFRSTKQGDIENHLKYIQKDFYDAFIISGGDGTINIVLNCLMKYNLNHIPISIIPSGTANDFARFLRLPKEPDDACKIIANNKTVSVDVGLCNEQYFINVCAGGLFANVSEKIDKNFKEALGKLGYYIAALQDIHTYRPINLKITNSKEVIEDKFDLFLVLNSSGTGSIKNLSPTASISDGLFDFVGFKNVGIANLPSVAIKYLKGEYLEHDKILFFTDKQIKIESLEEVYCDLDGEKGPMLPITIKNMPNAIKVFIE